MTATINQVVLGAVSQLRYSTSGGPASAIVEATTGFQASRGVETRPIYTYDAVKPVLIITIPAIGNGSFSYIASDGDNSEGAVDWSTRLTGESSIEVQGHMYPDDTQLVTLTFEKVSFGGQSQAMNARGEMQVTVNFLFAEGTF